MKKIILIGLLVASTIASSNDIVSRVIYSEASDICSSNERYLVASVIKNRINHPGFARGRLKTMKDVVLQKGAFSCIRDNKNGNWTLSEYLTTKNKAYNLAKKLATVEFKPFPNIVYYHDKSITKPKSWDNKYWKSVLIYETKHFKFYGVIPK